MQSLLGSMCCRRALPRFSLHARTLFSKSENGRPDPPPLSIFHTTMNYVWRSGRELTHEDIANRQKDSLDIDYVVLSKEGDITEGVVRNKMDMCKEFGLQARDLRLFDGNAPATVSPALIVRDKAIVYSSSVLRAIFTPTATHVMAPSQNDDGRLKARELAEGLSLMLQARYYGPLYSSYGALPYELHALEAVLQRLTAGYRLSIERIQEKSMEVLGALEKRSQNSDQNHEDIRDISDCRHSVEDFLTRAKGLQQLLNSLLREDEDDLSRMYLTARLIDKQPRSSDDHDEVELMLENTLRKQDETVGVAEVLRNQILSAERILDLSFAATRNALLMIEIKLDIIILAFSFSAAVWAAFGMNLVNGLENHPSAFFYCVGLTLVGATFLARAGFKTLRYARITRYSFNRALEKQLPIPPHKKRLEGHQPSES